MENLKTTGDGEIFQLTKAGTVSKMETTRSGLTILLKNMSWLYKDSRNYHARKETRL
jgi:hypothetical protein